MRSPPDTAGQAGERFGSGTRKRVMDKVAQNIQETFLNSARKDKIFLTIYLISGVKLAGRIKSFDKYSVVLEANNQEQLIFKHAISTIVISKPLNTTGHASGASQTPGNPLPLPDISENNH
jgi:host factor-I protein